MTGSGTQTDPYIVNSWTEFEEALSVSSSTAYISFDPSAETKYIDMDTIYPEGCPMYNIADRKINGNGWTIDRLYLSNSLFTGYEAFVIQNFRFTKIKHDTTDPFIDTSGGLKIRHACPIYGNEFSGYTKTDVFLTGNGSVPLQVVRNVFDLKYYGTDSFRLADVIRYDSSTPFKHNNIRLLMQNGTINSEGLIGNVGDCNNNLFDIRTAQTQDIIINSGGYSSTVFDNNVITGSHTGNITINTASGVSVFNADTMPDVVETANLMGFSGTTVPSTFMMGVD